MATKSWTMMKRGIGAVIRSPKANHPPSNGRTACAKASSIQKLIELLSTGSTSEKGRAARKLAELALVQENRVIIADFGAIPPLVELLRSGSQSEGGSAQAASALWNLATLDANKVAIASVGAIPVLVSKLDPRNETTLRGLAAGALSELALNDANGAAIVEAGGIQPLVILLQNRSSTNKESAGRALWSLSLHDSNKAAIIAAGAIPPVVALLSEDDMHKTAGAGILRELATTSVAKTAIASAGAIPHLQRIVRCRAGQLPEIAAGALERLTRGHKGNQIVLAQARGIEPIVALLQDDHFDAKELAAMTLQNLADHEYNRGLIEEADGIPALMALMRAGNGVQQARAAGALRKVIDGSSCNWCVARPGLAELLVGLLDCDDNDLLQVNAAGALRNLTVYPINKVNIARVGCIPRLIRLLGDSNDSVVGAAAATLSTLASLNQDEVRETGGIGPLIELTRNGSDEIKEFAADTLRILAEDDINKVTIVQEGGLPPLAALLISGSKRHKTRAVTALSNLAARKDNVELISRLDVVPSLEELLRGSDVPLKDAAQQLLDSLDIAGANRSQLR